MAKSHLGKTLGFFALTDVTIGSKECLLCYVLSLYRVIYQAHSIFIYTGLVSCNKLIKIFLLAELASHHQFGVFVMLHITFSLHNNMAVYTIPLGLTIPFAADFKTETAYVPSITLSNDYIKVENPRLSTISTGYPVPGLSERS
jgi:hypothetical protein